MISIIIPVYNVEEYIRQCLDSIVNQTYSDIEIIIINDGSTDRSYKIIESYLKKYKNIIYIYQENKGVSIARNNALKQASGEYVLFVDSDDYIEITAIEKMYQSAKIYNSDIVICGHIEVFEENNNKKVFNYNYKDDISYSGLDVLNMALEFKVKGYLCDKLFKKDLLLDNNFYLEPNRYIEDWLPVIKCINKSKVITFVKSPLYYYRQRNTSSLHTISDKLFDDYIYTVNKINNYLYENNIKYNKKCKEIFNYQTYYSTIRYFYLNNITKNKNIYTLFKNSNYYKKIDIKKCMFNTKLEIKLKIKILLWNFKVFHLFYR
ncbi:glycosyltransferase [Clostridium botulinum]|nr:glycosyltransferase [Clostridium botulinum]